MSRDAVAPTLALRARPRGPTASTTSASATQRRRPALYAATRRRAASRARLSSPSQYFSVAAADARDRPIARRARTRRRVQPIAVGDPRSSTSCCTTPRSQPIARRRRRRDRCVPADRRATVETVVRRSTVRHTDRRRDGSDRRVLHRADAVRAARRHVLRDRRAVHARRSTQLEPGDRCGTSTSRRRRS